VNTPKATNPSAAAVSRTCRRLREDHRLFGLRPVRLSVTMSKAFFAEPLAWSTRPSFYRCLLPVSAPAASFTRPFALSMFLWVMSVLSGICHERPSGSYQRREIHDEHSLRLRSGGDR
jgi:hypothetical protein